LRSTDRSATMAYTQTAPKSKKALRQFGLIMAVPLSVIGGILVWKNRVAPGVLLLTLAGIFLLIGLVAPNLLRRIERAWMALAEKMGIVMTFLILTLTYVVVITPMGFIMRRLRKDLLEQKLDPKRSTYWKPVDPDGPTSRPDKPF